MVTTIQIRNEVKNSLNQMRVGKESYEMIILRMIKLFHEQKRKQKQLLVEGYKEMAKDNLKMSEEWGFVDADLDWDWK